MIRIPETPDLQPTRVNMPEMTGRAPQAAALGDLAKSISNVGDAFAAHADRIDRIDQAGRESQIRNQLSEAYANHQIELEKNPDPASYLPKTQEFLQQQQSLLDSSDISPETKARLGIHFDDFATRARIDAAQGAARLANQRAGLAFANELDSAKSTGDRRAFEDAKQRAIQAGVLLPEKAAALDQDFQRTVVHNDNLAHINADPNGWLQENPTDKPLPDYNPIEWQKLQDYAQQRLRSHTYDAASKIQDAIVEGKITTPEQIDQYAADLRPSAREELKITLLKNADAADKSLRASPEYQAQTVGQVSAMLADYQPASDDFDRQFVQMDALTRTLPEGAVKAELQRRIKDVRDGKLSEIKTHADSAMAALDAAYKGGRFGKLSDGTAEMTTARVLNDGFLTDQTKLASLGLTPDQIKSVTTAGSPAKQLEAFRSLGPTWNQRQNITADPFTAAAAEALLNEKTTVSYLSPEAEDEAISARIAAETKYGNAKTKLAEFLKINPNATPEQIDQKVFEIGGEETRRQLSSGMFAPKPSRTMNQGANPSTAASPVGKNLTEVVKNFEASEGFFRTAYWDVNQWSIGYGTKAKEGEVIDQAEADRRLAEELAMHRKRVEDQTAAFGMTLNEHEKDALTSFDFNTGRLEQLLAGGTRSKQEIADKMLLYRNAGGQRMRGLENRRAAERELFLKGYR